MQPLEGILVVSVEQAVAAPFCTARLRESGARVIKIERESGDFARGYDSVAGGDSSYFIWTNLGKESLVLDFKDPDDANLLHRILTNADVFVQNLAPGALERSGFGSSQLRSLYPKLITCDISGYGTNPDVQHLKAYDFLVQAESGIVSVSGGENELGRVGVSICDINAGMNAHAGVLEALILREKTGESSGIEVSLFGTAADLMTVPLLHNDYGGKAPQRAGLNHPSIAPYGGYETKDGEVIIVAIQNEREWNRFCQFVLLDESKTLDDRFCTNNLRVDNRKKLNQLINESFSNLTRKVLIKRLSSADIAFGSVNSVADFSNHNALQRRSAESSIGTEIKIPARPIHRTNHQSEKLSIPAIGQHNSSIRHEFS